MFENYFSEDTEVLPLIQKLQVNQPLELIRFIPKLIEQLIVDLVHSSNVSDLQRIKMNDDQIFCSQSLRLKNHFYSKKNNIFIGKGTLLEASALIKQNTYIGENCELRQGAYVRGNVIVCNNSIIGHTTEIKNSIFMSHSEAGHFAYIGDSIIGSYVNLGAGTKLSNLELRTLEQKKKGEFPEIQMLLDGKRKSLGISKLGAVIGDGSETGCNSVLCPAVFLEKESKVFPNITVKKGFYSGAKVIR